MQPISFAENRTNAPSQEAADHTLARARNSHDHDRWHLYGLTHVFTLSSRPLSSGIGSSHQVERSRGGWQPAGPSWPHRETDLRRRSPARVALHAPSSCLIPRRSSPSPGCLRRGAGRPRLLLVVEGGRTGRCLPRSRVVHVMLLNQGPAPGQTFLEMSWTWHPSHPDAPGCASLDASSGACTPPGYV